MKVFDLHCHPTLKPLLSPKKIDLLPSMKLKLKVSFHPQSLIELIYGS